MNSLRREIFLTHFDRSRSVGMHYLQCGFLQLKIAQSLRYSKSIAYDCSSLSCWHQVGLIFDVLNDFFFPIPDGIILPGRINGRVSEYINYTEPGENDYSLFWVGFVISLFSSLRLYYTYGVTPPYSVFDVYFG